MNRLSALVLREMSQTAIYVAGLAAAPLFITGFFIVAKFHLSLSVTLQRGLSISLAFGVLGVLQLVQMTILKEKSGGGFLFLRMLPVNDAEIISSKLLAILLDVLIICGIPLMVTSGAMIYYHVGFPAGSWLAVAWCYVFFTALAVGMAACAIQFDSQRALLFPLLIGIALIASGYLVWKHLPMFVRLALWFGIQNWGIFVAMALIWLGWLGTIHIFSKQDFVQLSE
ncbi:MAG: hypothetical protein ACRD4R_09675 [Candidatus Acidiferrales bacterium]